MSICHCLECQRRTGSVFAVQARFARRQVTMAGEASTWSRPGDDGPGVTFRFCPTCAAIVWWEPRGGEDFVMVAVGAFADRAFPAPTLSVYADRQHPWALAAGELPLEEVR